MTESDSNQLLLAMESFVQAQLNTTKRIPISVVITHEGQDRDCVTTISNLEPDSAVQHIATGLQGLKYQQRATAWGIIAGDDKGGKHEPE